MMIKAYIDLMAEWCGKNDSLVNVEPVLSIIIGNWQKFLAGELLTEEMEEIRKQEQTGRPLGGSAFVDSLERKLGRKLKPHAGRKPREK
jgi:hypothetical protein